MNTHIPCNTKTLSSGHVLQQGQPGVIVPDVFGITGGQGHMILILTALLLGSHAQNISGDAAIRAVVPVLVSFHSCAVKHKNREPVVALIVLLVEAELMVRVSDLSTSYDEVLSQAWYLLLNIPVEWLTSQAISQRLPLTDITIVSNIL